MVASMANRPPQASKTVTSQGLFQARATTSLSAVLAAEPSTHSPRRFHVPMSTATTTSHDTGQHTSSRATTQPNNSPITQTTPNAAQRLRTTMAAVKLAFAWLGVRKTLAPEQRTTAARAFHADRELLSATTLLLTLVPSLALGTALFGLSAADAPVDAPTVAKPSPPPGPVPPEVEAAAKERQLNNISLEENLPEGWKVQTTPEGYVYYVDAAGNSSWTKPAVEEKVEEKAAAAAADASAAEAAPAAAAAEAPAEASAAEASTEAAAEVSASAADKPAEAAAAEAT